MNRIVVGQDLCGNATFLETFEKFNDYLGIGSVVIGQYVPYFLTEPFGYLASIAVRLYRRKALRYLVPEVQARIDAIQFPKIDPAFDYKPPADIIQWSIGTCKNASAKHVSDAILSTVSSFILLIARVLTCHLWILSTHVFHSQLIISHGN